jgi:hypothetical protein
MPQTCGVDSRPHKGVPGIAWSVFASVIAMMPLL